MAKKKTMTSAELEKLGPLCVICRKHYQWNQTGCGPFSCAKCTRKVK